MASLSNSISSNTVLFSYHKNNKELVMKIYSYLKNANLPVWIDNEDGMDQNISLSKNGIIEKISVLVCFMTPMYQASKHFQHQVQFATSEGIPIIGCHLLTNWKPSSWLNKITNNLLTVDLRGINPRNFESKTNQLRDKINGLLRSEKNSQTLSQTPVDQLLSDRFSLMEKSNFDCLKKNCTKSRMLPEKCRLDLSNLMICSNEYILIVGNNHLHLFDRNLKLVRSNNQMKIITNDLKDLSWCSYSNSFLILTKKEIYVMNPLTSRLSTIENFKLKDQREEFVTCSCSEENLFLIKFQTVSKSFYFEEYSLPTYRFLRRFSILDLLGTSLFIQNGLFNQNNIQQILSIKYYQEKIAIIMKASSDWFIYIFHLYDQPTFSTKILLEEKSRLTVLGPTNQWIIFNDHLSNSFIQMSMDFLEKSQTNEHSDFLRGFLDFNRKLRSISLFGITNLVFLIDNALVLYQL